MKHPSKEMLQTSMPKLISEVAEALSMNKCYRQNIREIFYDYKNAVNVSKHLYTKVAEMLVQFEKKHAEYFYSNYFSTIVKESEKYFLNIEKSASTLLASRLADKLFSFFKTPQDKLVNSEIKPKPINQRELDGLQYLSGYVIKTKKRAKNSKTHLLRENQIIISILSNAILPDFAEKQNQKLVDIQTRGGLTKVIDEAQEMIILAEQLFHKTTETEKHLKKIDISAMTEELLQDTKIISLYKAIIGTSDTNGLDNEVKVNLLENILKLYLRVRSFSFVKDITSHKKQKQRNLKFKTKALRNDIKKASGK